MTGTVEGQFQRHAWGASTNRENFGRVRIGGRAQRYEKRGTAGDGQASGSPHLDGHGGHGREASEGELVFEEVGVGNLLGLPLADVRRVVDEGRVPLALVVGVG